MKLFWPKIVASCEKNTTAVGEICSVNNLSAFPQRQEKGVVETLWRNVALREQALDLD